MTPKQEHLFGELNTARYGDDRRKRPLFLPGKLREQSRSKLLAGPARDRAYEIMVRWADLESSGKLETQNETALEGEFLTQVFGEALGYALFSEGQERWNLKPKYSVNGGQADAAIGLFGTSGGNGPRAVIELKGPRTNVDRDKFNGRTAVQQCWDYLNALPPCPWGIVCNYVSFRIYHRNQTPNIYELFTLADLRNEEIFQQFYCLLQRDGVLPSAMGQAPRMDALLEASLERQRQVGDELYDYYDFNRIRLIQHLCGKPHNQPLDEAIRIAQKLIDRIVFVAFCEDRELLPDKSLRRAWEGIPPFSRVTNPRWQNYVDLFRSIETGNPKRGIAPYNGGLFKADPAVDDLELDDDWTDFFKVVGEYDFRHEVNVDVLGHLFEKSIKDIERIRLGGLFETALDERTGPKMKKSAERKRGGVYYTPPEFTSFICEQTVGRVADERLGAVAEAHGLAGPCPDAIDDRKTARRFVEAAVAALRDIKVVDPACGSGAFLIQAYDVLEQKYLDVARLLRPYDRDGADEVAAARADYILHDNLFGVDLSQEAVEITQLALWLRSAHKGRTLADLSNNILCRNSLVSDAAVDRRAMDWKGTFAAVFERAHPGFDCVIGNPPWERMKVQEREFFDAVMPEIAASVSAATRRRLIAKLQESHPELHAHYLKAKSLASDTIAHIRTCGRYLLTGRGDVNTYSVFAELSRNILRSTGRAGVLVPSGIGTEHTTRGFFTALVDDGVLEGFYDFENMAPVFRDVHRSYKFCILLFNGRALRAEATDFVFFAHTMEELRERHRHITLSTADLKLLNPNTHTCPILRSTREAELVRAVYRRVPVLIDRTRKKGGNPWGIRFLRMFDQTNDAEHFRSAEQLKAAQYRPTGTVWKKGRELLLPLYESKMFRSYDHRYGSVYVKDQNWMNQGQTVEATAVDHQNPEFFVAPRWWVSEAEVIRRAGIPVAGAFPAFRNVTRATDTRTVIASFIPFAGVANSAPLILFKPEVSSRRQCCLLANLNVLPLDYVAKRKIPNVNLNFFIVEQLPIFSPDFYSQRCPWDSRRTLERWVSDRVLKLTCTSNDMRPLAEA
ncbi:MAG TPA: hypothetical protein ENN81_11795, partial [Phycisphaerales bacterium]|nr:hypothetical protein [Phycisphaerales bacterium]